MIARFRFAGVLIAGLTLAACHSSAPADLQVQNQPIAVAVAPVQGVDQPIAIEATGGFEAAESSDVAPETSGTVTATLVDIGDRVKAGDVLVRATLALPIYYVLQRQLFKTPWPSVEPQHFIDEGVGLALASLLAPSNGAES